MLLNSEMFTTLPIDEITTQIEYMNISVSSNEMLIMYLPGLNKVSQIA